MENTTVTEMLFRKDKEGDIVAIMPYEIYSRNFVDSYQHCGQHSACHLSFIEDTTPATPEEYADLKRELEGIGYNVKVIRKVNQKKYLKKLAQFKNK